MSLPTSRNTTYAPNDKVKSVDLNDFQDQIIAAAAGKHPATRTIVIPAILGTVEDLAGTPGTWVKKDWWVETSSAPAAAGYWLIPLSQFLPAGVRITTTTVYGASAGAGTNDQWAAELVTRDAATPSGGFTSKSASNHASGSGNNTVVVLPTSPAAIAANEVWYMQVIAESAASLRQIMDVKVTYDWP